MGKLMLYGAGRSLQCLHLNLDYNIANNKSSVPSFKTTNGSSYSAIYNFKTSSNSNVFDKSKKVLYLFDGWKGSISSDNLENFDVQQYAPNSLSNINYSRSNSVTISNRIYTINATNNNTNSIIVNSIQFTKTLVLWDGGAEQTVLVAGYFLDEPVTIEAGKTKTFAVNIDCWNY